LRYAGSKPGKEVFMKRILLGWVLLTLLLPVGPAAALRIGDPAPDFTAPSTMGEITLSRQLEKGPVVLAFYFADFTSG